jgi:hypothetical protein
MSAGKTMRVTVIRVPSRHADRRALVRLILALSLPW